jgi:phosphoribosylformylglycinamidine synthase PurS subunit
MKVIVKVMLKNEVLDSQGRAVEKVAKDMGFAVDEVRVGKSIVLDIPTDSKDQARETAQAMAKQILHNPLIETFAVEVL